MESVLLIILVLCFFFCISSFCILCPMLHVSLDCPFLILPLRLFLALINVMLNWFWLCCLCPLAMLFMPFGYVVYALWLCCLCPLAMLFMPFDYVVYALCIARNHGWFRSWIFINQIASCMTSANKRWTIFGRRWWKLVSILFK